MLKYKYKDNNCFWIISNSYKMNDKLKSSNIHSIQTYDLKNLFTNIPITSLKEALLKTVEFVLDAMNAWMNYLLWILIPICFIYCVVFLIIMFTQGQKFICNLMVLVWVQVTQPQLLIYF